MDRSLQGILFEKQILITVAYERLSSMADMLSDRSEIRTRAIEVTGALNQRLRPLGHPATEIAVF